MLPRTLLRVVPKRDTQPEQRIVIINCVLYIPCRLLCTLSPSSTLLYM